MANSSKVAEIFEQASVAFGRLAQLTLDLKQYQSQKNESEVKLSSKWTLKEIDLLKSAVSRFGNDLNMIAEAIESKTVNQIKHKLKSRVFQLDRGRRKQNLDKLPEENEDLPKRPKMIIENDYIDSSRLHTSGNESESRKSELFKQIEHEVSRGASQLSKHGIITDDLSKSKNDEETKYEDYDVSDCERDDEYNDYGEENDGGIDYDDYVDGDEV